MESEGLVASATAKESGGSEKIKPRKLRFTNTPSHGFLHVPIRRYLAYCHLLPATLAGKEWGVSSDGRVLANATTVFLEEDCRAPAWQQATGDTVGVDRHVSDEAATARRLEAAGSYASPALMRAFLDGGPCKVYFGRDYGYVEGALQPVPGRPGRASVFAGSARFMTRATAPFVGLKEAEDVE